MRCDGCGAESDRDAGFVRTRRSFRSGLYTFCPDCVRRGHERVHAAAVSTAFAVVAVGLVLLWNQDPAARDRVFTSLVNFYLAYVFAYASIVPHELGHVLGAHLAGMRVFQIWFGTGRRLLSFCVRGVLVEVRPIPINGFVRAACPDPTGWRWRTFLFIATGPAVNAALLGLALLMIGSTNLIPRGDMLRHILPWHALAAANVMLLLASLYPHTVSTPVGPHPSDGRLLLQALRGVAIN
jgi:hypothetical protein